MRVAYLVADPGVPVFGTKGASVHVQEIVRAFRSRGDEVTVYATRLGDHVPSDLADARVVVQRVRGAGAEQRERGIRDAVDALTAAIVADGCDLVYERFSLFSAGESLSPCSLRLFLTLWTAASPWFLACTSSSFFLSSAAFNSASLTIC